MSVLFYRYGRPKYEKLGETTFLKNEMIELKLITRHEYLPLHYSGDAYSVACRSNQTTNFKEQKSLFIEEGWNTVPSLAMSCLVGDSIKCDHQKLSEEAKKNFYLFGNSTIVSITEFGVNVSFTGCQVFTSWNIALLINELKIYESPEFKQCQEYKTKEIKQGIQDTGNMNCFYLNFIKNKIIFSNVHASDKGVISFSMTSKAFKNGLVFHVESIDFGKTWQTKILKKDF